MKNNTQPALKERIEKALDDFTKGRSSMHVPPLDTDVDMVLAECSDRLSELEARCAALAAENAGLKVGRKFFMYSDDSGFETYKTQEEAIKAAQKMIDACLEDAYDGWPEETDTIRWGVVIQQATETDFKKPAPDNGWEGSSDYKLLPETQETPATDAFLAEVKREATEPLEKEIESLKKQLLMSVGDIRDLIDYNPETGVLTAKVNFSGRQAGSVIGSQTWQGYYAFSLFGKKCFAHRLAWLLHYGEWPSQPIDHINGIKTDNSIRNLRLCSLSQNQFNKPTQKNNTTGVKGVYWNKRDKRYVASVQFNGKKYSAGHHKDIESAKEAVMKLREKLAGEFTNHGEFELAAQLRKGVQS